MEIKNGLLKKVLNVFLCTLMVITLISVNTGRISAEDNGVSNEETSEVNQSEDKPDETDNTPTEEDNSIDEDADVDNEEDTENNNIETENEENTPTSEAVTEDTENNTDTDEEPVVSEMPLTNVSLGEGSTDETDYYFYKKETLDSSFEFEVGKSYIFGSSFYTVDYANGAYSYALDDGFRKTVSKEEFEKNTDLYSKVTDNQDGTYVVRHHYIVATKEEYDVNPEYQAMDIVWTQNADIVDEVDYNFMCLSGSTNQFDVGYTITSDEIPDFSQEKIWNKYKIDKSKPNSFSPNFENIYLSEKYEFLCEKKVDNGYIFVNSEGKYICATPTKNSFYLGTYEQAIANPVYVETVNNKTYVKISDLFLMQTLVYSKPSASPLTPNTNALRFYTSSSNKTNISVYSREESQTKNTITYYGKTEQVNSIGPISYKTWVENHLGDSGDYCFNSHGNTETADGVITHYEYVADNANPIGIEIDCDENVEGIFDDTGSLVSENIHYFVPEDNSAAIYSVGNGKIATLSSEFKNKYTSLLDADAIEAIRFDKDAQIPESDTVRLDDGTTDFKVYGWANNNEIIITSNAEAIYANPDCKNMFSGLENVSYIDVSWFKTTKVKDMSHMFENDENLSTLNVSNFNTSNVTDMSYMFSGDAELSLDLSSFNTSNVTHMSNMFYGFGDNLESVSLDLSNFNTSKVTDMSNMFYDFGKNATSVLLNLSGFDTSNVTNVSGMFTSSLANCDEEDWIVVIPYKTGNKLNDTETFYCNDSTYAVPATDKVFSLNVSTLLKGAYVNVLLNQVLGNVKVSGELTESIADEIFENLDADSKLTSIQFDSGFVVPTDGRIVVNLSDSKLFPVYAWLDDDKETIKITSKAHKIFANENSYYMFADFKGIKNKPTVFDLTWIDTSNVTDMSSMFYNVGYNASSLSLDLSKFDTSNVTNMSYMFGYVGYSTPSFSLNLSSFDTSNVTDMSYMFSGVGYNTSSFSLNLSSFNTSNVTDMSSMFSCAGYNTSSFSLNLSSFNTSNVTDMSNMFYYAGCYAYSFSLNLSSFNTSNVTDMSYMFSSAGEYKTSSFSLDLSSFNTSNVTSMSNMFSYAGRYATSYSLDVSSFDTSNVTNMYGMFSYAGYYASSFSLDLSNFNTSNVTSMSHMFYNAGYSASSFFLNLSSFNTSNVTDMSYMFDGVGCNVSSFSLNLSSFNTSNVTNMAYMFYYAGHNATTFSIDLSNFDTSKVLSMSGMFSYAGYYASVFSLDLSNFNTSKVTNMSYMFNYAGINAASFSLDLSSFDTSKVTSMNNMFYNAGKASTADNWKVIIPYKTGSLTNTTSVYYGNNSSYNATPAGGKEFSLETYLTTGKDFNAKLKSLVASGATYETEDSTVTSILFDKNYTVPDGKSFVELQATGSVPVYAWLDDDGKTVKITSNDTLIYANANPDSSYMFYNFKGVSNIEADWLDTTNVTDMSYMFANAGYNSSSFSLDLFNFDTANVTDMSDMFADAGYASAADDWKVIIPYRTGSLTNTTTVYYGKSDSAYGASATDKEFTFIAELLMGKDFNVKLKSLVNPKATYKTEDSTITSVTFDKTYIVPDEGTVVDLATFRSIPVYAWLDVDSKAVKITSVTDEIYANLVSLHMFYNLRSVSGIEVDWFDTSNVTNMDYMFSNAGYKASSFSLDVSSFNTSKVVNMSGMFSGTGYGLSSFSLDLSKFDTSKVTNMSNMFYNAGYSATSFSLDISKFDTSNVTNMSYMFNGTGYNLSSFTFKQSNFNTSKVTDMSYMFANAGYNASSFSLDLSNFNTSNVTSMSGMFSNAGYKATTFSLDISSFDTSNVTNMSYMFNATGYSLSSFSFKQSNFNTSKVTEMSYMFANAGYKATTFSLDLSNFDTSKVNNMSGMFNNAGYSTTTFSLDLSNFDTSKVTSMHKMFDSAGHNATTYSLNVSSFNTSNVTNMAYMFASAGYKATSFSLGLSNFDTSKVNNMSYMFNSAGFSTSSFSLDLSNFNTSNVTSMYSMFYCAGYNATSFSLDLSNFNTSNVNSMSYMFYYAGYNASVFSLDLSDFNTSKVTDISYMFSGAGYNASSFSLDLSGFNTSAVIYMSDMFKNAGNVSTAENWKVIIPYKTGSLTNTTTVYYGKTSSYSAVPASGKEFTLATYLTTGQNFNKKLKSLVTSGAAYSTSDSTITSIQFVKGDTVPAGKTVVELQTSGSIPVYAWRDNETIRITSVTDGIYANPDSSYMFYNFKGVSDKGFTVEADWFITRKVTDMDYMFANTGYNASSFSLDLFDFDTSKVTEMSDMFTDAGYASAADNWKVIIPYRTGLLTNTTTVYYGKTSSCSAASATGKEFTFIAELLMGKDFNVKLKSLVNPNATYKTEDSTITSVTFDKSYIVPDEGTVVDLATFRSIPVYAWLDNDGKTVKITSVADEIYANLVSLYMFYNIKGVSDIEADWFDTSNVTNMDYMFSNAGYNASSFSLDLSNFDTSKVANMSYMFSYAGYGASSFSVKLSSFDTSNVTNMGYMFSNAGYNATSFSLDVSKFDTSKVTAMNYMFGNAGYKATSFSLDLSKFDTSKVTNISDMFTNAGNASAADDWKVIIPYKTGTLENSTTRYYANSQSVYTVPASGKKFTLSAYLITGQDFNTKLKSLVKTDATYETSDSAITSILFDMDCTVPDGKTSIELQTSGSAPVYAWLDDDGKTVKITSTARLIYANPDSSYMFYNFKGISDNYLVIDLSWFDTANITNMSYMFAGSERLASLDLSGFNTSNVTNMSHMFDYARGLKSLDLSKFDTSKVTDMSDMFYFCNNLTVLDLSNFNTENVTDMSAMFKNCTSLNTLDVSSFNTSKVTDMSAMFNECSAIKSIDISVFDTSKVTDMSDMFKGVSNLAVLDLSNFNIVLVTDMTSMFENMYKLTSIKVDEETWNTASVTSSENMFTNDKQLKGQNGTTYSVSNTNKTYAVVDKAGTPGYLTGSSTPVLTDNIYWAATQSNKLYISDTDLSSITDETVKESGHFAPDAKSPGWYSYSGKSSITDVIVNAGISPEYMSGWFENFKALTTITNISNINTVNTLSMNNLFDGCSSLTAINLTSFNTSKVTDMSYMFNGCTGLTELDLSNFNTYNVKKMSYMFASCTDLTTIKVTGLWGVTSVISSTSMFEGDTSLVGGKGTLYSTEHTDKQYAHIDEGEDDPGYLTGIAVSYTIAFDKNDNDAEGTMESITAYLDEETVLTLNSFTKEGYIFDGWNTKANGTGTDYEDGAIVVDLATKAGATVTLYAKWKEIDQNIYWAATATDGTLYIAGRAITTDDLKPGETIANSGSFNKGTIFTLYGGGWKNYSTKYTKAVFADEISPSSTAYWFSYLTSLNSFANIEYLNTADVTDMTCMFTMCTALTSVDLSGFDTGKVTSMSNMFGDCTKLESLDVSGFDTSKVTTMQNMFSNCPKLTTLDVSGFNTGSVTSMKTMFSGSGITSLDLSGFDTANVTDMSSMLSYCASLESVNLSGFTTSEVTKMSSMFAGCTKLSLLDLTSFNTSAVADMSNMFKDCSALTTIKVIDGKWSTVAVTKSTNMFAGCTSLVGGSDTPCDGINNIDKTYARVDDPSNSKPGYLTGVSFYTIVYNANKGTSPEAALVDKAAVNTNYKLLTNTFTPKDSDHVFAGWNTQSDGKGTYYSENATVNNLTNAGNTITLYAVWNYDPIIYWGWNVSIFKITERVLNIASTKEGAGGLLAKGQFRSSEAPTWSIITKKLLNEVNFVDEISPVSTADWFNGFTYLKKINNISNLDTSNVTDMSSMFRQCSRLTSVDLSGFDTSKVTNMSEMFNGCEKLTVLDLRSFTTPNLTNTTKMFSYCDNLVAIIVKNDWDLSKVTSSSKMFKDDNNLRGGYGTAYDSGKTDKTYARIGKEGIPGYFTDADIPTIYYKISSKTLYITSDPEKVDSSYKSFSAAQIPGWSKEDTSSVTTVELEDSIETWIIDGWFNSLASIKAINNLNYLDTSKVYDMSNMFNGCSKLVSLDLSGFDTSNVLDMSGMFAGCNSLKTVTYPVAKEGFKGFDTAKVTDMSNMFKDCKALTGIDLSTFDTSNVTDMSGMFSGCNSLTAINYPTASGDFKGFDTSKVTDMSYMFNKCYSIKSLNLYDYDTTKVTDMSYMFNNCTSLKLVDLSNQSDEILSRFDVSNVTDMTNMFNGDTSLKTIIVSGWTLNENVKSDNMFKDCTSIVGEQGTVYNAGYIDRTYARVDEAGKELPGYLTGTFYRFQIGEKQYTTFASALSEVNPGETIVMINDSNESLTYFVIDKNITLDLNGNNLTVKSANFTDTNALIIDSAVDEEKGSFSFTAQYGFVYKRTLAKTESTDTSVRYIPVCISNNTYQFNEVLVGTANKTTSSQYWREGDQAFVGSYLRNDLDVPTILADGSGVNLGIKISYGKTDKELVFERETIDEYIEKYTHAKPYFHVRGIEEDSITVNGYVTQKNGSIDYRFDGISRNITLVK